MKWKKEKEHEEKRMWEKGKGRHEYGVKQDTRKNTKSEQNVQDEREEEKVKEEWDQVEEFVQEERKQRKKNKKMYKKKKTMMMMKKKKEEGEKLKRKEYCAVCIIF